MDLLLAAVFNNTVGFHLYKLVTSRKILLQLIPIKILFIDDAADIGNAVVFVSDL